MSAIQGIEGVISQLQATAMSARAQESLPQPTISFAGQLHAALDRISVCLSLVRKKAVFCYYTNSRPHAGRKIHPR